MFPIYSLSANTAVAAGATHDFSDVGGAAHREVTIKWTYDHPAMCGGVTPQGRGDTTFQLFPDGRIVRTDHLEPMTASVSPAAPCNCSGATMASTFVVTT